VIIAPAVGIARDTGTLVNGLTWVPDVCVQFLRRGQLDAPFDPCTRKEATPESFASLRRLIPTYPVARTSFCDE
jgi:hypothetical protein